MILQDATSKKAYFTSRRIQDITPIFYKKEENVTFTSTPGNT